MAGKKESFSMIKREAEGAVTGEEGSLACRAGEDKYTLQPCSQEGGSKSLHGKELSLNRCSMVGINGKHESLLKLRTDGSMDMEALTTEEEEEKVVVVDKCADATVEDEEVDEEKGDCNEEEDDSDDNNLVSPESFRLTLEENNEKIRRYVQDEMFVGLDWGFAESMDIFLYSEDEGEEEEEEVVLDDPTVEAL